MLRFLSVALMMVVMCGGVARANDLTRDTSDPLFLQATEEVLTSTSLTYWDHILRAGQAVSYGLNSRLAMGANVHYQHDFNGDEDGFSAIDLGGTYRMSAVGDNASDIVSDVLFGFKFGGSSDVRTPEQSSLRGSLMMNVGLRSWTLRPRHISVPHQIGALGQD